MAQTIAERQGVSRKYLDSIFAGMRNAGLIRSRRGAGGGHELARKPQEVTVGDVIRALEGAPLLIECVGDPGVCPRTEQCVARDVWAEVETEINGVLDRISLEDLLQRQAHCAGTPESDEG